MKRIILLLTVALLMAAMIAASALPAFAIPNEMPHGNAFAVMFPSEDSVDL